MNNWPISDRPLLRAPGYVKMPGRPRKERRREPTEKPKGTKMSKTRTVIRCRKCKGIGHNRSTCDKRNGTSNGNNSVQSVMPNAIVATASSAGTSSRAGNKRKAPSSNRGNQQVTNTTANARVATRPVNNHPAFHQHTN